MAEPTARAAYVDADPRMLRGIAHPLRRTLLYELHARGAATATMLAGAVDRPVNSVSFHLRQLAKYGLIDEAPDRAQDRRQRWWRASGSEGLVVDVETLQRTPDGEAAFEVFRRTNVAQWHALVDRFFSMDHHQRDQSSRDTLWVTNDVPMLLTKAEAEQYADELYAVMRRWATHGQSTDPPRDEARRTYLGLAMLLPHQTDLVE